MRFPEGGAPEGSELEGVPEPGENTRVPEPLLTLTTFFLYLSFFLIFVENKYFHGNMGTCKIEGAQCVCLCMCILRDLPPSRNVI